MADASNDFSTILGPDAVFKGQLEFEKAVRLLGKFEGEVNASGRLVIEEGAILTGDVKAGEIRVNGQVKGNLEATQKVELSASARVEGDLHTARLEVVEGAVLVGRCMVGVDGQGKPTAGPTKPSTDHKAVSMPAQPDDGKAKAKDQVPAPAGVRK